MHRSVLSVLVTAAAVAAVAGAAPAPVAARRGAAEPAAPSGITPALTGPSPRVGPPPGPVAVVYRVPVDAPVADPFRPPATPYGPGNRGIDFATTAGQPVLAMADGVVVFAGQVGGTLHVVVRHADGVRTSYSFLAVVLVSVGQPVHVGARVGDEYIDPASLWSRADGRAAHAHLVPDDPDRPLGGPADERAALQGGLAGLPVRR